MHRNEPIVWITENAILQIIKEGCYHYPDETGGILMGYHYENSFLISHIIGPGPKAIHTKTSFTPDDEYHENEIAVIYKASNGSITYLGDWHTHPGEGSYLSALDKSTLKKISDYKLARLPEPLMIILGTFPVELKCWKYKKKAFAKYQELIIRCG